MSLSRRLQCSECGIPVLIPVGSVDVKRAAVECEAVASAAVVCEAARLWSLQLVVLGIRVIDTLTSQLKHSRKCTKVVRLFA